MNDEELIERIINLNYREFGAEVGNDLKRIIIKQEKEIERLKNIIDTFEEELERESNIKEEQIKLEHNTFININNTLKAVLRRFKEIKGEE